MVRPTALELSHVAGTAPGIRRKYVHVGSAPPSMAPHDPVSCSGHKLVGLQAMAHNELMASIKGKRDDSAGKKPPLRKSTRDL